MTGADEIDWRGIPGQLQEQLHRTATAVRVFDWIVTHWWIILLVVLVIALLPRGRRSS